MASSSRAAADARSGVISKEYSSKLRPDAVSSSAVARGGKIRSQEAADRRDRTGNELGRLPWIVDLCPRSKRANLDPNLVWVRWIIARQHKQWRLAGADEVPRDAE